jgi:hypothetical protein
MPHSDVTIIRNDQARGVFSLTDEMFVERGSRADWDVLHSLHYKAEALPAGPQYYRCVTASGQLVGVIVFCPVSLMLGPRHALFPKLKPGGDTHFTNVHRAKWLNQNMTRAARIVTDTLYRGTGVSYRMVNLAMRMYGAKYCEIQSSMSKFNPFDLKAGFKHGHLRQSRAYDKGMEFFQSRFVGHPADHEAIVQELNAMNERLRTAVIRDIRLFYYKHSAKEKTGAKMNKGTGRVDGLSTAMLVRELQQLVFATPVYGIWSNPDVGLQLPDRLPINAFDWQKPGEAFNQVKLKQYTAHDSNEV